MASVGGEVPDIFLSYSRHDRPRVERLAEALIAAGYTVWWDRNLTGGKRFLAETQAELSAAKAVLVVWTETSVTSHWVADEAGEGRDTGRLVPIALDGATPPLGFRQFQVLDFSRWTSSEEAVFGDLLRALAAVIGAPSQPGAPAAAAKPAQRPTPRQALVIGGLAAAGLAVLAGLALRALPGGSGEAPPRLAFFGFVASDTDPARAQIATIATNEVFAALSAQQVRMAARSETVATPPDRQFARAGELGARFTMTGELTPDPETPDRVRVSMRLEDATTRTTLWEEAFTGEANRPVTVAVRAASRASDTTLCVIGSYTRLQGRAPVADLLTPLAVFCGGSRGLGTEESARALERLAVIAPDDAVFQALFATTRITDAYADASTSPNLRILREAERALGRAQSLDPEAPEVAFARYALATVNQRPLSELETILRSGIEKRRESGSNPGYQLSLGNLGNLLSFTGRFDAAIPYLKMATDADPFSFMRRAAYVQALVNSKSFGAVEEIRKLDERWEDERISEIALFASAISEAGNATARLNVTSQSVSSEARPCWRSLDAGPQSDQSPSRSEAAAEIKACLRSGRLSEYSALLLLVKIGDLDGAFEVASATVFRPDSIRRFGATGSTDLFFIGPMRAMRADPRFIPLVEKLGLMDYWRTTRSQPDVCADEDTEFCSLLRQTASR